MPLATSWKSWTRTDAMASLPRLITTPVTTSRSWTWPRPLNAKILANFANLRNVNLFLRTSGATSASSSCTFESLPPPPPPPSSGLLANWMLHSDDDDDGDGDDGDTSSDSASSYSKLLIIFRNLYVIYILSANGVLFAAGSIEVIQGQRSTGEKFCFFY